ncbi:hypothetical protein BDV12DRAFT_210441 [Aspergillus spectabilis]
MLHPLILLQILQGFERDSDFWAEPDGFQPHSLLSHPAMKGKFSLQNILSTDHGGRDSRPASAVSEAGDDPAVLGLINTQVALCLLEYFMQKINPYISQLDPTLHTFTYLRRSPFLLTTVLAVAAKAFESALYPDLHAHAERLFADCFRRGDKSTEVIQAILLLTYWKEPNDTRAWTSVGLAIRIAMDLGWHKLSANTNQEKQLTETHRRELRNIQRTMLVLFVYDRSLSLQTDKPWMIERTELIESADSWWRDPLAIPNDQLLCSFVSLRLITADTIDLLIPSKTNPVPHMERLLTSLDNRIHAWQRKWLEISAERQPEDTTCHAFLIKFYGSHLRLQLSSIPLQKARTQRHEISNMKPFWLSYEGAVTMLQLVAESSPLLYLAQDSIHIMTAYAAIFLIKLILSSPSIITPEIELPATEVIRNVRNTFAALSAPSTSSCRYLARFLKKGFLEFTRIRTARSVAPRRQPSPYSRIQRSTTTFPLNESLRTRQRQYAVNNQPREPHTLFSTSRTCPQNSAQALHTEFEAEHHRTIPGTDLSTRPSKDVGFLFNNDDMWADMFAHAGFNVQEGVFFRE